jgi:hypothetical protein
VLFIGNSFTFGAGSAVQGHRTASVTDLNAEGIGGVPALFKSFSQQAGLQHEVFLETHPGSGIDWHLAHKQGVLSARAWDTVVMHGYSTLDAQKPGDATRLVASVAQMANLLHARNPALQLHLTATWPRADQTYEPRGAWYGQPIEAMARDVRAGYDRAAAASSQVRSVVPVGQAWVRAMHSGVADANPYDGITPGRVNLWSDDRYHASAYGSYLTALVVFGRITGLDPRLLGPHECSAAELGFAPQQAGALQQVAFDELAAAGPMQAALAPVARPECPPAKPTPRPAP